MILLSGNSLNPARKVPVEAMSIQLKERDSSASLTPADMTGIQVNSWLKDEGNPGNGIVWRVKSIAQAYATDTPTVSLEHAIATLKDRILFGAHGPAQITGNSKATTCTALQAIRYILSQQSDWTLGSFPYNVANPYKFDGDTLFDALETVSDSLPDAWWSYDFSSYPFKLNITQKSSAVASELRVNRNLRTITKTIDKSGMFTRFYPIGANDLHLDGGGYVEKNTAAYGVVSKVETDNSISTKAELQRWANERLNNHAEPTVSIDVDGLELADATGESMDRLTLGAVCRIPLTEYGTTIQERIVSLSYQDKVHQPEVVKITLSNNRTDITKIIADNMKRGGRSSRASARREKEDMAWFEDTNDHVSMCAKGIIGVDAAGNPNWVRLTELIADGNGLSSTVSSIQNDVIIAQSQIVQQEKSIGMVVRTTDQRPVVYYPKKAYFPKTGDTGKLYYAVDESRYYEWKNGAYSATDPKKLIDAGQICVAINESGESEATIQAKKIYLLGQTIAQTISADYINAKIAGIQQVNMLTAYANTFRVGAHIEMPNGLYLESNGVWQLNLSQSGNTYTLTETKLNGTEREVGTFSRATSLSGAWSGNIYTVTASPQGNTLSVIPAVHVKGSQGGNYVDICVGVNNGSSWTDHGNDTRLSLSVTGLRVDLLAPGGGVMATINATNPYPSSMTLSQKTNSSGAKQFTAYYLNGSTYVSMGQAYWYSSGTNLNVTSKTVHY